MIKSCLQNEGTLKVVLATPFIFFQLLQKKFITCFIEKVGIKSIFCTAFDRLLKEFVKFKMKTSESFKNLFSKEISSFSSKEKSKNHRHKTFDLVKRQRFSENLCVFKLGKLFMHVGSTLSQIPIVYNLTL